MTNEKSQNRWLWYPGDFEIRHGLLQNFQRLVGVHSMSISLKIQIKSIIKKNVSIQLLKGKLMEESYSILDEQ